MSTKLQSKKKGGAKVLRARKRAREKSLEDAWRDEDRESLETLEFIQAIDRFKRRTQKAFPTWSEVLAILKSLGYRKEGD